FRIELRKTLRRRSEDLDADMSGRHGIDVSEVEHPWVPAGMHRLSENQPAELAVVCRLANYNSSLVRLSVRRSRDEVLLCDVVEVSEVIGRLQLHQGLVGLSRTCDFRGNHGNGRDGRRRGGCCGLSASTLSALTLRRLLALPTSALSLNGNRQL